MNSVSPRFYAEILHKTTAAGNFLQADSSVFNLFTPDDPALPKELIAPEGEAKGRFDKYIPRGDNIGSLPRGGHHRRRSTFACVGPDAPWASRVPRQDSSCSSPRPPPHMSSPIRAA
jgi:hypothetical protein